MLPPINRYVLRDNLLLAVVMFREGEEPRLFLIPSTAWLTPNRCLVRRDYVGKKSVPEWGIQMSQPHHPYLAGFGFAKIAESLHVSARV